MTDAIGAALCEINDLPHSFPVEKMPVRSAENENAASMKRAVGPQ